MRWRFKGSTPVSIKVLFALMVFNFAGQLATAYAVPHWAALQSDAAHSYLIHLRGSPAYFVQPWLGAYFDYGFWLHFVLLGLAFLMAWIHRDELERIG
ncbi:MAG TPA: hypothetical protein VMG31_13505 [Verrucomicrobiae bacterium]|nr:hypothetical protein [Verrucomicrobiae bacterium]